MKQYLCDICNQSFSNKSNLNRHTKSIHGDEKLEKVADFTSQISENDIDQEMEISNDMSNNESNNEENETDSVISNDKDESENDNHEQNETDTEIDTSEGEEAMVDENSEYDADEDEKSNNSSSDEEVENDEGKETTISKFRKMFGVKRKKKHHMNKFSKHQKLIENICDVPSINETDNSFWVLLMNFWDNEWSLQEKYGNFVRLSKLSEKDEIFRFINNYTCHLRKLCSFDVAFRVAMNQASSFLKDIEDKIANGEDNVDEDMVENEEDSSEDEDDKENILSWKLDLSFWKLLLSDMSALDNKTDERILSFIATDYQMKSNALHIKIMREHSNLMNHLLKMDKLYAQNITLNF